MVGHRHSFILLALLLAGCTDPLLSPPETVPVVEAYFLTDAPPPPLSLTTTAPLEASEDFPLTDARVELLLPETAIPYRPDPTRPGIYIPEDTTLRLRAGWPFRVQVTLPDRTLAARDTLPPPVHIDEVCLEVPPEPVEAVFADSLSLSMEQGWLYLVSVCLYWEGPAASPYWIHPVIQPPADFPSAVIGLFLRLEDVQPEAETERDARGRHRWQGLYAVPVPAADAPFPAHVLDLLLIRGTHAYARFAATRDLPERREPISNVENGRGIAVGMAMDTLRLLPEAAPEHCYRPEP